MRPRSGHPESRSQCAGLRGMSGDRFGLDASAPVSDMRPCGLLRQLTEPPRHQAQSRMAFQGEHFTSRFGRDAAAHSPPIRRMLAMGIPVGGGTDATRVASYNPWIALYWLVSGKTVGGATLYARPNRLSREKEGKRCVSSRSAVPGSRRSRQEGIDRSRKARRFRAVVGSSFGPRARHQADRIGPDGRGREGRTRYGRVREAGARASAREPRVVARGKPTEGIRVPHGPLARHAARPIGMRGKPGRMRFSGDRLGTMVATASSSERSITGRYPPSPRCSRVRLGALPLRACSGGSSGRGGFDATTVPSASLRGRLPLPLRRRAPRGFLGSPQVRAARSARHFPVARRRGPRALRILPQCALGRRSAGRRRVLPSAVYDLTRMSMWEPTRAASSS